MGQLVFLSSLKRLHLIIRKLRWGRGVWDSPPPGQLSAQNSPARKALILIFYSVDSVCPRLKCIVFRTNRNCKFLLRRCTLWRVSKQTIWYGIWFLSLSGPRFTLTGWCCWQASDAWMLRYGHCSAIWNCVPLGRYTLWDLCCRILLLPCRSSYLSSTLAREDRCLVSCSCSFRRT